MESSSSESPPKVIQHLTKASSDQLLRKFAEIDSDSDTDTDTNQRGRKSLSKRRKLEKKKKTKKKTTTTGDDELLEEKIVISPLKENNNNNNNININLSGSFRMIERKSLLRKKNKKRNNNKKLGILRSSHPSTCKHKSVLGAIEKTWSKVVKGASKVFMEKHYNRHRILNSDIL